MDLLIYGSPAILLRKIPGMTASLSERRLGREAQQTIPVGLRFAQRQPTFYLAQPTALYFLLSPHFASLHAGYARYIKNFSLDKAYPEFALLTSAALSR